MSGNQHRTLGSLPWESGRSGNSRSLLTAAGGGGPGTLLPGLLAEIERVVKVLSSKMQRPTQSTTYQTEREDEL